MMSNPSKIMTEDEYSELLIEGPHIVCKSYRGEPGCLAIWYISIADDDYLNRQGHAPALRARQERPAPSSHGARARDSQHDTGETA
jgi:hypothetical protein